MRLAYLGWVLCLLIGAPGMALAEPLPVVNIRVVDLTEIGRDRIVDSLDVTRSLFRSVDIAIAWTYCSGTSDDCSTPLEANEVWLRIVPGHATQDGWARKWVSTRALGFSNLDADPDAAIMSTVFAGQVTRLARAARTSSRTLLWAGLCPRDRAPPDGDDEPHQHRADGRTVVHACRFQSAALFGRRRDSAEGRGATQGPESATPRGPE